MNVGRENIASGRSWYLEVASFFLLAYHVLVDVVRVTQDGPVSAHTSWSGKSYHYQGVDLIPVVPKDRGIGMAKSPKIRTQCSSVLLFKTREGR